eukprot:13487869-Ditylum_brightwellii.AAC.1
MENFKWKTEQDIPHNFFPEQIAASSISNIQAKQCIPSGSPQDCVELCVDVAGMRPYSLSEVVFTRELISKGKPAMELFLYTAEKMRYLPHECLVVEDSSSQAAGMDA